MKIAVHRNRNAITHKSWGVTKVRNAILIWAGPVYIVIVRKG